MGIDPASYAAMLARTAKQNPVAPSRDDVREGELHNRIITEHLIPVRWPYIHSRMDKPPTIRPGWPDFTIFATWTLAMPLPRIFIIEIKIGSRKLDDDQLIVKCELEAQGYVYHVARTFEQYLEIVNA